MTSQKIELDQSIKRNLDNSGYSVIEAFDLNLANELVSSAIPDLAIIELIETNGIYSNMLAFIHKLASSYSIPVILPGDENVNSLAVCCLDAGADRYIPRLFSSAFLLAQINALFRRAKK